MNEYFKIQYSDEVEEFFEKLENKARDKIVYNIDKAKFKLDPKLFSKLNKEI